jgi:hypothetical protein
MLRKEQTTRDAARDSQSGGFVPLGRRLTVQKPHKASNRVLCCCLRADAVNAAWLVWLRCASTRRVPHPAMASTSQGFIDQCTGETASLSRRTDRPIRKSVRNLNTFRRVRLMQLGVRVLRTLFYPNLSYRTLRFLERFAMSRPGTGDGTTTGVFHAEFDVTRTPG